MRRVLSKKNSSAQAGNALVFVFIGIVLFAALTYTFYRASRSPGKLSLAETLPLAQQIVAYAERVDGAVQNVMLQNGCLESQISFDNAVVAYPNGDAPVNKKCNIFDLAGGGLHFEPPPAEVLDTEAAGVADDTFPAGFLVGQYIFRGNICVDNIGTGVLNACAPEKAELLMMLPWVTKEICEAINQVLKHDNNMVVDTDGSFDDTKFDGSFDDAYTIGANGETTFRAGCYHSTGVTSPGIGYHFYYTLLAR